MKKLNLLLILTLTITLFSCGSDDDGTPQIVQITEANLIGDWELTSNSENGTIFELETCVYTMKLSKKENGDNLAVFIEGYLESGSCNPSTSVDYVWSVSNNTLNTGIEGNDNNDDSQEILELTATTLVLKSEETYTENGETQVDVYVETFTKMQ